MTRFLNVLVLVVLIWNLAKCVFNWYRTTRDDIENPRDLFREQVKRVTNNHPMAETASLYSAVVMTVVIAAIIYGGFWMNSFTAGIAIAMAMGFMLMIVGVTLEYLKFIGKTKLNLKLIYLIETLGFVVLLITYLVNLWILGRI